MSDLTTTRLGINRLSVSHSRNRYGSQPANRSGHFYVCRSGNQLGNHPGQCYRKCCGGHSGKAVTVPKRSPSMPGLFPAPPTHPRIKPVRSTIFMTDRLPIGAHDKGRVNMMPQAKPNERTNDRTNKATSDWPQNRSARNQTTFCRPFKTCHGYKSVNRSGRRSKHSSRLYAGDHSGHSSRTSLEVVLRETVTIPERSPSTPAFLLPPSTHRLITQSNRYYRLPIGVPHYRPMRLPQQPSPP